MEKPRLAGQWVGQSASKAFEHKINGDFYRPRYRPCSLSPHFDGTEAGLESVG
jgi:hypothetical protein